MKKILPWVIVMAVIAYFFEGRYVKHSEPYEVAVTWIKNNQEINADVGTIKRIYPDMGRYSIGSSGDFSRARLTIYVDGSIRVDRIAIVVQQKNKSEKWEVTEATSNGIKLK